MTLRLRLILSHTFIVLLCLGTIVVVVSVILQGYRDRFVTARLDDMTIPIYVHFRSLAQREASWNEVVTSLQEQAQNTGVSILLTDNQGNVLMQASPEGTLKQRTIELPPEGVPEGIESYRGTYKAPDGQTFIFTAYPLSKTPSQQTQSRMQILVLSVPRSGALALWGDLVRPFLWAGLTALAVSIVIAILLARSVYHPVQQVTEAAEKMAQGQYDQEVPVAGPKETKRLASSFNQMAKQVELTQQRLRYFLADASHQLRTPLTSIRGFAQAILDGTASDDDTRLRAAQVIEDESKRMIHQVDELLELSRMQSGQIQMARESIDLKDLLEHCQEIFSLRAEEAGINFKTEIEPLMPVVGDIDRLEQVFSNLLDNALKHSPVGGEVSITGRNTSTDNVEISVTDGGPGIPPEQLPHVFERFYQATGARTGTGLGLAIAREIVQAHGGQIDAKSSPGEGTQFIVRLPTIASNPSV